MGYLQTFQVFPKVPEKLAFLEVLIRNLWWCWHLDAIELFRRINPRLWENSGHNPILFSTLVPQERLNELAEDESFLAHLERVKKLFTKQTEVPADFSDTPYSGENQIAYFSMEFGLHESLPLFAGGLGILAGDHLKAASDRGLPIVGIGLLYRQGYFHQYLSSEGWQQEEYPETDLYNLPVHRAMDAEGKEVHVTIAGPDGTIRAAVWKLQIGRIPLYLLDTNLPENPVAMREITSKLYSADGKVRLAQEVLLGIGGMQLLQKLGINPLVCHMNEGHCAFAGLERLAQIMTQHDIDLNIALEIVARTTIFTTHTPVAAGHDEFPVDWVKPCLAPFKDKLGLSAAELVRWGQPEKSEPNAPLSMFVLGLRMSQYCNGVSRLHGDTARRMWSHVWPGRPVEEVPIAHITNGIHIPSWISIENSLLFDRYLGPDWQTKTRDPDVVKHVDQIYDEELWRAHDMSRARLIRTCRSLMVKQHARRNAPKAVMKEVESVLDQDSLTIAFARRFATYKRANLLLQDPERFEAILTSTQYPVQFIFAGKAHPKDNEGKELIKRLIQFARNPRIRQRLIFIEDYDINIARHLVQGADIWLNTPRRPYEACGTSGMKAAVNGVLNVSIMDGWWDEAYTEQIGWRIGNGEEYDDPVYQDMVESQALYNILENDVIPCFYDRRHQDVPEEWLRKMKASIKLAMQDFSALKMVDAYEGRYYQKAANNLYRLTENGSAEARKLNTFHVRLSKEWQSIKVGLPAREEDGAYQVGGAFRISTEVFLGNLEPDEVDVELYYGSLKAIDTVVSGQLKKMTVEKKLGSGSYLYACTIICEKAGRYGYTARVTPRGDDVIKYSPGLITWA